MNKTMHTPGPWKVEPMDTDGFSYIISEIGYTFSTIRQTEEQLEKTISTLSKMTKFYALEPELANLAKSHLISNQNPSNDIYP